MAPRQLSIFETADDVEHAHLGLVPTETGYRVRCSCGWMSDERKNKPLAHGQWRSHLAALPAAARMLATVRVSGRWSHA